MTERRCDREATRREEAAAVERRIDVARLVGADRLAAAALDRERIASERASFQVLHWRPERAAKLAPKMRASAPVG